MVSISGGKEYQSVILLPLLTVIANVVLKRVLDFPGTAFFCFICHLLFKAINHHPYLSSSPEVLPCHGRAIMHEVDKEC